MGRLALGKGSRSSSRATGASRQGPREGVDQKRAPGVRVLASRQGAGVDQKRASAPQVLGSLQ